MDNCDVSSSKHYSFLKLVNLQGIPIAWFSLRQLSMFTLCMRIQ